MFSASTQTPLPAHQRNIPTILLIDDSEVNSRLTAMSLKAASYLVRTADSLDAGRQIIANGGIHAVVAHLSTEGASDPMFAFLRELRETQDTARIPVILVTGEQQKDILAAALVAGANCYLQRPYHRQELLDRIRQCLENQQA